MNDLVKWGLLDVLPNVSLIKKTKGVEACISQGGGRVPHKDLTTTGKKIRKEGIIKRKRECRSKEGIQDVCRL